jgi:hypothetical protein
MLFGDIKLRIFEMSKNGKSCGIYSYLVIFYFTCAFIIYRGRIAVRLQITIHIVDYTETLFLLNVKL